MRKLLIIALLLGGTTLQATAQESVFSFSTAKKKMYKTVYQNQGDTFYCGCSWAKKKVDLASCGLQSYFPKKQRKRSSRTEAEHIITASRLLKVNGKVRQCVIDAKELGEKPRAYCQKKDRNYKQAHNDLVNLVPAVGQVNADRSNKPFVDKVKYESKTYGQCNVEISSRGIIPPDDKRGDIARIAAYMSKKYGASFSKRQKDLFFLWSKLDPISQEEIDRDKRIVRAQGYGMF